MNNKNMESINSKNLEKIMPDEIKKLSDIDYLKDSDMNLLWREMLQTGIIASHIINRVNHKSENILGFLFKFIINNYNNNKRFDYSPKFNFNELLDKLKEIPQSSQGNQPLVIGINNYLLVKQGFGLNKEHWEKIIDLTNKSQINEYIDVILKSLNKSQKYNNENRKEIIDNILKTIIEKDILTKENNTKVLFKLIELGFKEGLVCDNEFLGTLIEKSNDTLDGKSKNLLNTILENHLLWKEANMKSIYVSLVNDYIHFINEDNFQKIIDKTNVNEIILKKEWIINNKDFEIINEDNFQKIIDKTNVNEIILKKEWIINYKDFEINLSGESLRKYQANRNKVLNKIMGTDFEKLMVYCLGMKDEKVFKNTNIQKFNDIDGQSEGVLFHKSIFNNSIEEIITNISQSNEDSLSALEFWINNRFIKDFKAKENDIELKDKHIETLINAIDYKKTKQQSNIASLLLKKLDESTLNVERVDGSYLFKSKEKLQYFKKLLDKNKEIPGKNGFLIKYYFDKNYEQIINLTEEDFKNYIDIKAANNKNSNFLDECINQNLSNPKRTQSLVSFAIDIVNLKTDTSRAGIVELFTKIENAKNDANYQDLKNRINSENLIKLISKEKLFGEVAITVLLAINKIENIWEIKINKETIINNIDFDNIDFQYQKRNNNKLQGWISNISKYSYLQKKSYDKEKIESINPITHTTIWDELLIQKNKQGEKVFSNEEIKFIVEKIDFENEWNRRNIIASMFEENQIFIKHLIKEEPEFFENFMNKIIDGALNKMKKEITEKGIVKESVSYVDMIESSLDRVFLTDLTKKLLRLKEFVDFSDEIILKSYSESNESEITKESINKAGVAILMKEDDLNNIEVAHNLIKRNKENFYKLGKQLIEFLQLNKDNSEEILKKYSEENTKGILNIFKRKEKEKLQSKINEAISYAEKQRINIIDIKKEIDAINKVNLTKEEKEKVKEVMIQLEGISKNSLKELSITENADLKRCIENSYIKVIKNYVKLSLKDKEDSLGTTEDFKNIMDYCIKEIDDKTNSVKISKKHKM